jgi:rhamnosyl/mannosyltransferase
MNILHIYKDFYPPIRGGIEGYMALLCRYQRQWAEVAALTCSRTRQTREVDRDGTRVTEVGEWGRALSTPLAPAFPYHLRRLAADVNVVHVPCPTAEMAWLLARPRGRLVVRYHSDVIRQARTLKLYKPLLMTFLRQADIILPTSEQYVATSPVLQEVVGKCHVVPLGVEASAFAPPPDERVAALRARYGGEYVLFSGRHRYYKGLPYLVEAAQWIEAPVVMAGDGPERIPCQKLAERLGVNVVFPGELSHEDLVAHLYGCEVFVFPSIARSEAFGLSILEAHACGKPVVATRLGTGVEFANLHGQTGLNVPPEDPRALAGAVNQLLHDEILRHTLGRTAQERVAREFAAETVARREFEEYQKLL